MKEPKPKKEKSARELAYQILLRFELETRRLDDLEDEVLKGVELSARDRRLLKTLGSGSVRNLLYLDWIAAQLYKGKYKKMLSKAKTILRLALYELIYLTSIPEHATLNEYVKLGKHKLGLNQSKMINAVLRNYLRQKHHLIPENIIRDKQELLSIKYSFPEWLLKRWISLWGIKNTEAMLKNISGSPAFDFYLNNQKTNTVELEGLLTQNGIAFKKSDLFQDCYKIKDIQALVSSGLLDMGYGTIQDESAHIPVQLLEINDNDVILDVCAAPGGKYIQILQSNKYNARAVAVDIDLMRLKKVKQNLERLGIEKGYLVVADGVSLPFKPVFTKILLDAPCSGLGVISKHPDIKWRRSMEEIWEFARLQIQLIQQASSVLQKKGVLVYSTCTIDTIENEKVVNEFLSLNGDNFELQNTPILFKRFSYNQILRTFPDRDKMDGSFSAILKKI